MTADVYTAELVLPRAARGPFEALLDGLGDALITGEEPPNPDPLKPAEFWRFQVLFHAPPERAPVARAVAEAAALAGLAPPPIEWKVIAGRDWVSETNRLHAPLRFGRFILHGSHDAAGMPRRADVLLIDAGRAFGTGRHPSTAGCLVALQDLAKAGGLGAVADVGCGSGVLALAAARLGARPVYAGDIDPVAVTTTRENARANRLGPQLRTWCGPGLQHRALRRRRFDLLFGNILSRPLMAMAGQFGRHAAPGGWAILSGLLAEEERVVKARFRQAGFVFVRRVALDGWVTLVLRRPAGKVQAA